MPFVLLFIASALLLSPVVIAQLPNVPHGGGNCSTDYDCSLGGVCESNVCACDIWFTGPTCALLNLQPPVDSNKGTCGPSFDSYYSWGGRSIFVAGKYHLYASFMW